MEIITSTPPHSTKSQNKRKKTINWVFISLSLTRRAWGVLYKNRTEMRIALLYRGGRCPPVHDFLSKTLSSNTTVSRIRHLVKKNDQKRHLVDFFYERSTTLGRKKPTNLPSVVLCCFENKSIVLFCIETNIIYRSLLFRLTRLDTLLECVSCIA